jgi:hypothetical protein
MSRTLNASYCFAASSASGEKAASSLAKASWVNDHSSRLLLEGESVGSFGGFAGVIVNRSAMLVEVATADYSPDKTA